MKKRNNPDGNRDLNKIQPYFFLAAQGQPPLSQKNQGSLISFTPAAPLITDYISENN